MCLNFYRKSAHQDGIYASKTGFFKKNFSKNSSNDFFYIMYLSTPPYLKLLFLKHVTAKYTCISVMLIVGTNCMQVLSWCKDTIKNVLKGGRVAVRKVVLRAHDILFLS